MVVKKILSGKIGDGQIRLFPGLKNGNSYWQYSVTVYIKYFDTVRISKQYANVIF